MSTLCKTYSDPDEAREAVGSDCWRRVRRRAACGC